MERRRRVCGWSDPAPFPPESQSQRRGRERRRERGGRRAASPSPSTYRVREVDRARSASPSTRRGRERRWERDGPRGESPRTRRGRERRLERAGDRNSTASPRRGRERRWERDGARGETPRTRRGCERRLENGGASYATPSPRRGRGRQQERDGPRDASPSARRGRNRRRERDAPRTISTAPHLRSARRAERDGPRGAEQATHRPRTASPTSDRRSALRQELEGPQPRSSTLHHGQKRRRQEYDGSAPPTSHSGDSLATSPTPTAAQMQSVDQESSGQKKDQDASAMVCLNAGDDLLGEIIIRLHPTEISRMMCGQRIHRLISRTINPVMPQMQNPFLGVLVQYRKSPNLITVKDKRMLGEIRTSVAFCRGSLKQLPEGTDIIDSRDGLLALRFGKTEKKFCICSPFQRKSWIVLPPCIIETDDVLGGALINNHSFGFCLLLICLDKSAEGPPFPVVVKIFQSETRIWKRVEQQLHLSDGETVFSQGVYCKSFIYFLCKKGRQILKVDPLRLTTDMIALPKDIFPQMALTRVGNDICLATAHDRQIFIFQYNDMGWVRRGLHHTPSECYWTKVVGSAEDNGMIIVETGSDQTHALKVQDGSWICLEDGSWLTGKWCSALEISSPYRYPFSQPMFELEEIMPEFIRKGYLKDIQ